MGYHKLLTGEGFVVSNLTKERCPFERAQFSSSIPENSRLCCLLRISWAGHVARMEERRVVYRVLVGKPEGKRPLGRPRRRWEDNIKMDL